MLLCIYKMLLSKENIFLFFQYIQWFNNFISFLLIIFNHKIITEKYLNNMNQAINIIPAIVTLDNNIGSQTTISI